MNLIPEIFPSVQWFILAKKQLNNHLLQNFSAHYSKYINKYVIAGPNQLQTLTVPLISSTKSDDFSKIQIDYSQKWIREHKNALQTAYGKSPFFEYYDYRIFQIFDEQNPSLEILNMKLLKLILKLVGLENIHIHQIHSQENNDVFVSLNNALPIQEFPQVFQDRFGFRSNVSILDLLFNQGPMCKDYFDSAI